MISHTTKSPPMAGTPRSLRLGVEGMDCASCATKIENALQRMPGVGDVTVSVPRGTVTVSHDGKAENEKIQNQISDLGYQNHARGRACSQARW